MWRLHFDVHSYKTDLCFSSTPIDNGPSYTSEAKSTGKITKNVTGRHLRIYLYGLELGIRNYPANWVFFETSTRLVGERCCTHLLFARIKRFQWIENCGAHFRREHDQWIMGSISIFAIFENKLRLKGLPGKLEEKVGVWILHSQHVCYHEHVSYWILLGWTIPLDS